MRTKGVRSALSLCVFAGAALWWQPAFAGLCNGVSGTLCEDFEGGASLTALGWHVTDCNAIGSTNWLSIPLNCNNMTPYPTSAFQSQPTFDENVSVDRIRPPGTANSVDWGWSALGGDFWKTPWPIGKSGQFWVGTYELRPDGSSPWGSTQGDGPQGAAYSASFFVGGGASAPLPFLSFLIGGGSDINNEKVELVQPADSYATQCLAQSSWAGSGQYHDCFYSYHWTVPWVWRWTDANTWDWNGSSWVWNTTAQWLWRPAVATGGMSTFGEQLNRVLWDTRWSGQLSAIRITDAYSGGWGHINVDNIQQTQQPVPYAGQQDRVWGLVDAHAHWMNSLSASANPPPTTPSSEYLNAANISDNNGERTQGSRLMWGLPYYHPTATGNNDGQFSVSWTGGTHGAWNVTVAGCNPLPGGAQLEGCRFAEANQACSRESHRKVVNAGTVEQTQAAVNGLFLYIASGASSSVSPNANDWENFYPTTTGVPVFGYQETGGLHPLWGVDPPGTWSNSGPVEVWRQAPRQYLDPIHEAMYYTWVKRAWQGGLRIMNMDVGNSMGLEATLSELHQYGSAGGRYLTATDDLKTIHTQVKAIKRMVNEADLSPFVAIAYNPLQARSIITSGKLALVLGVELDDLGHLRGFEGLDPHVEIAHLQAMGIRKLFPVHIPDNVNGGAAAYNDLFNTLNDALGLANPGDVNASCQGEATCPLATPAVTTGGLMSNYLTSARMTAPPAGEVRAELNWDHILCNNNTNATSSANPCWITPEHFFRAVDGCAGGRVAGDGYCSQFLLSNSIRSTCDPHTASYQQTGACSADDTTPLWTTIRAALHYVTAIEVALGGNSSPDRVVYPIPASFGYGSGAIPGGSENSRGLTNRGTAYIQAMMDASMLIDVSHMGEKTKAAVIGRGAAHAPPGVTGSTAGLIWNSTASATAATCSDSFNVGVTTNDAVASACRAAAYPVIDSHTGFRQLKPTFAPPAPWPAQSSPDGSSYRSDALGSERDMAPEDIDRVLLSGGMVGVGTGGGNQRAQNTGIYWANNTNRCDGSSTSFSQSYYYVLNHLYALWSSAAQLDLFPGVAFGTDFNGGATQLGTRFNGIDACFAAFDNDHGPSGMSSSHSAQGSAQIALANGVFYGTTEAATGRSAAVQPAMTQLCQAMDGTAAPQKACWNFNTQGLSNYGLLPDLFQDLVNQGDPNSSSSAANQWTRALAQYDLRWAYQGADQFLKTWTKAVTACQNNNRHGAGPRTCLANSSASNTGNPDVPVDYNGIDATSHALNPWDGAAYFAGTGRYAVGQTACPSATNCP